MKSIGTDTLEQIMKEQRDIPVINVLDEDQYRDRHIKGSINVPYSSENFTERVASVAKSKESPVVVYCASETCDASTKAAKTLEQAGFQRVYDFEGGTKAWQDAKLPLESSA